MSNVELKIVPRNMRGGKCMGDVQGVFKRATESGRSYAQFVCPKVLGRKQRGKLATTKASIGTNYLCGGKSYVNP